MMQKQMAGLDAGNLRGIEEAFQGAIHKSGLFRIEQVRSKSAVESFTEALQKNDITFRKLAKSRQLMNEVLKEQYRLQKMTVTQWNTDARGRMGADIVIPRSAPDDLAKFGKNMEMVRKGQMSFGEAISQSRMKLGLWSQALGSASTNMVNWGKNTQWAGRQMMVGLTVPFAAAAAGAGMLAYQFDKSLTHIARVYDYTAKSAQGLKNEQEALRDASMRTAKDMAQAYGSSGKETLEVINTLAATGQKGAELQRVAGVVQRASFLGQLDYNDALKATINMQSVYKMNVDQLAQSFDFLNALENSTVLSMEDMVLALPRLTGVVKGLGGDIKDIGILMTAARAGGLDAGEAANALKTIIFRSVAPTNKARETFLSLTNRDIDELITQTNGEAIPMLKALATELQDLNQVQRIQVVRDLFGIYQGSKGDIIIQQLLDMADAQTQVGRAAKVAGMSVEETSALAQRETKMMQESASGRFKKMKESLLVELAEMGEPFLEAVNGILGAVTKLMRAFNDLPDGTKKLAMIAVVAAAVIGPLVMIIGIMANFTGTIMKAFASMGGLISRFKAVSIEQRTQELLAGKTTAAFHSEAQAAALLAQQLAAVNVGLNKMVQSQTSAAAAGLVATRNVTTNAEARAGQLYFTKAKYDKKGRRVGGAVPMVGTGMPGRGRAATRDDMARSVEAARVEQLSRKTAEVKETTQKTKRNITGMIGPLTGVVALMGSMATEAGSMTNNLMNGLLVATMFGPLFGKLFGTLGTILKTNVLMAFQLFIPSAISKMGVGIKALGPMLARVAVAAGPIGLALGAAAFAVYQLNKNIRQSREEMERAANTGETWSNVLGYTYLEAGEHLDKNGEKVKTTTSLVHEFQKANEDAYNSLKQFAEENNNIEDRWQRAIQEGINVRLHGGSEQQAKQAVQTAMAVMDREFANMPPQEFDLELQARNINFGDAQSVAAQAGKQAARAFMKAANGEFRSRSKSESIKRFFTGPGGLPEEGKVAIQKSIRDLYQVYEETDREQQDEVFATIENTLTENLKKVYASGDKGVLREAGINNFSEFLDYTNKFDLKGISFAFNEKEYKSARGGLDALREALAAIAKQGGFTEKEMDKVGFNLKALAQLLDVPVEPAITKTIGQAMIDYDEWQARAGLAGRTLSEEQKLAMLNSLRLAAGLDATASSADYFGASTLGAADDLKKLRGEMALTEDDGQKLANAYKDMMGSVWGTVMDTAADMFDEQHERKMDKMEKHAESVMEAFDQQADALDDKWENKSRRFDDRWSRIMKSHEDKWDRRINKEKELEEQRQKMFEAEKARISELARMENATIDFNAALATGDVDEAARIMNSAQAAAAQAAMDADGNLSSERSEKKIANLEAQEEKEKEALDRRKELEQRAFDDEKKRQERLLEHRRKMEEKKLDAARDAAEKAHEAMKKQLELDLAALRAYIPKNEADMQRHIRQLEAKYDKHGDFIDLKGDQWGKMLTQTMNSATKAAQTALGNEATWTKIGERAGQAAVKGMFGMNMNQFMAWLNTGKMPKNADMAGGKVIKEPGGGSVYQIPGSNKRVPLTGGSAFHTGGIVGQRGQGGRTGFSGGKYQQEVDARLLKGEAVLNRQAVAELGPATIAQINKGIGGRMVGPGAGMAGMLGAGLAASIGTIAGNTVAMMGAAKLRESMMGSMGPMYGMAAPGQYGGTKFTAVQLKNAATIMNVGRSMGATPRDLVISLMTAMQESMLRNVQGGDRDSLGLFQQRPSQGWGTPAQIMNPEYAARQFFKHLLGIKNRDQMSLTQAAQAVQRSAFPDAYAKWEDEARAIAAGSPLSQARGGLARPVIPISITRNFAEHGRKGMDLDGQTGQPIFSIAEGRVGLSTALKNGDGSYRSYGEYVVVNHPGGLTSLYAHMSRRGVQVGQRVSAGEILGLMGSTGNSTGSHLHLETRVNGNMTDPQSIGIPGLRTGGKVSYDNTIANLHRDEMVLTAPLSKGLEQGIDKMANGRYNGEKNVFNFDGAVFQKDIDVERAIETALRKRDSRRGHQRRID